MRVERWVISTEALKSMCTRPNRLSDRIYCTPGYQSRMYVSMTQVPEDQYANTLHERRTVTENNASE